MPQKMWFSKAKKIALLVAAVLLAAAILLVRHFYPPLDASARGQFLRFVPADATSVVFLDLQELRSSPFLAKLLSWAPQPAPDSEYAQFVRDTGFNYERDLDKLFLAISNHGTASSALILAEGKFDRAKIESFLARDGKPAQQGSLKVFVLPPANANEKPLTVSLLSPQRIAITNSENLFAALSDAVRQSGHAEWQVRFDRLAGSPVFAVIRQDPALEEALGAAAPGGFRSPQLATLVTQLQWISIAGKPDADLLRIVAEGESSSETVSTQLHELLQGIQLLAQNGLNDPKLRRDMNPDERAAYLDLLKGVDVQKIDRGDSKSVRLILNITPQFLAVATLPKPSPQPNAAKESSQPSDKNSNKKPVPKKTKTANQN